MLPRTQSLSTVLTVGKRKKKFSDINKLMNPNGNLIQSNLARTNYSSTSKLYSETDFYIDQRDVTIILEIITNPN